MADNTLYMKLSQLSSQAITRWAVVAMLACHTVLLGYSAYVHSPTLNEPGHLVAGLSYWKFGRFDIYSVNPPLVRFVAALPVIAAGYNEDWSGYYGGPGARPEFKMGEDFVAANGERSFFLFMIARWACIPFSWIGATVCYLWARDLYGRLAGLLACAIWCFEPNILAHASLITPDAPATALGLAATYTFWRWLRRPTWMQAAITGIVLGLAELCKTTLIVFYPLWPVMWLVYRLAGSGSFFGRIRANSPTNDTPKKVPDPLPSRMTSRDWAREAGMLVLRMSIGLYVLNFGYGFEGSLTQLKEFEFVSELFTGSDGTMNPQSAIRNPKSTNRFANTWLGEIPMPFPKNYLVGIDLQQKDFEHYGRPSYLRGEWRDHGWWYYYLYAAAIKVPLGLWLMGGLALTYRLFARRSAHVTDNSVSAQCNMAPSPQSETRRGEPPVPSSPAPSLRDEFILLFPAIVIFTLVSAQTGFNEHFRYVLPAFPYFFIAVSQAAKVFEKVVDNGGRQG
jgi:hypothetical protein